MSRRARRAPRFVWLLAALLAVLILIGAGGYYLGNSSQPYRTAPEFPVAEYLATSSSLRGNTYRLTGSVLNSIAWSPAEGRLISVQPAGTDTPIPVVLPVEVSKDGPQKGQRFHFLVEVRDSGLLYVASLTKS
jgi:hypothetical protein